LLAGAQQGFDAFSAQQSRTRQGSQQHQANGWPGANNAAHLDQQPHFHHRHDDKKQQDYSHNTNSQDNGFNIGVGSGFSSFKPKLSGNIAKMALIYGYQPGNGHRRVDRLHPG
jgi:hypothetical protein